MLEYLNGKKEPKQAKITKHALERFKTRFRFAFDPDNEHLFSQSNLDRVENGKAEEVLQFVFKGASRINRTSFSKIDKKRNRKHGGGTVRYRNGPFDFVIEDGALVTVELCKERKFNKIR